MNFFMQKFSATFGNTDDDKCLKCNGASTYNVASSCKIANTDKVASSFKYLYYVTYLIFVLILTPTPFTAQKFDIKIVKQLIL